MYSLISVCICFLVMFIYNGYVIYKYGIPKSLSETAYLIGGDKNIKKYWFTLYCLITASTLLPPLFIKTPDNLEFIPFLFCTGFLFAGFSPAFKSGIEKGVHYVSAIISFVCFLLYGIFCMPWYWMVMYFMVFGILCLYKRECFIYFAEMLAIIGVGLWILLG